MASKRFCHVDFIKKGSVCLIAEQFNTVSGRRTVSAFSGLTGENRDGWLS